MLEQSSTGLTTRETRMLRYAETLLSADPEIPSAPKPVALTVYPFPTTVIEMVVTTHAWIDK